MNDVRNQQQQVRNKTHLFWEIKGVQHDFARFTLGWFVRMTGSEALFLMMQFFFSN